MVVLDPRRTITWEKEGNLGIMTVDNPPANQLSAEVTRDIILTLNEIKDDGDVKCVIYVGKGDKFFMAGADIKGFPNLIKSNSSFCKEMTAESHKGYNAFAYFPKPVIACLNGITFGGGLEVAMACDIRVASPKALLGLPEITLGILPGGGGTQRLPRIVGYGRALEIMLTGEPITAEEGYRIGLVNKIAPSHEETLAFAKQLGNKIARFSAESTYLIKKAGNHWSLLALEEGIALEEECFSRAMKSAGAKEGVEAFITKRKADFTGL